MNGKAIAERIGPENVRAVMHIYERRGVPLDRLPYTPEFLAIRATYNDARLEVHILGCKDLWTLLCYLRKNGELPHVTGRRV